MRALLFRRHGGIDVLRVEEVATPRPGPDEVLVRVGAVALNHLDIFVRRGASGPGLRDHAPLPHVSGADIAGTVAAVGENVASLREGDSVVVYSGVGCGRCAFCLRGEIPMCPSYRIIGEQMWGGLADYVVVPARNARQVPTSVPVEKLAVAGAAYTTAWRMLISAAGLRVGESVLVVGAGGGVASAAAVIAKHAGARVYAVSGQDWKVQRALELGAHAAANYRAVEFDRWIGEQTGGRGVDVVIDSVGASTWRHSIRSLATGGRMAICGATSGDSPKISIREIYQSHRRILGAPMGSRTDFDQVVDLIVDGRIDPVIHAVHPLQDYREAFETLESAAQYGKIVVRLED